MAKKTTPKNKRSAASRSLRDVVRFPLGEAATELWAEQIGRKATEEVSAVFMDWLGDPQPAPLGLKTVIYDRINRTAFGELRDGVEI